MPPLDRYARQIRFAPLGPQGQERLAAARVLVCGCGALGTVQAEVLVRAGVGHVRIVDRDFLELTNLQRQALFDEQDLASGLPKAVAAAEKLRRINGQVTVEPVVADVDHRNVLELCRDVDVVLDGTDNFETRFLLNDAAHRLGKPWVYGGSLGADGQTMTILPGRTPCLRCLIPEPPPPGSTPTCDSAGILASASHVIASLQALEALKIASGNAADVSPYLTVLELWGNRVRQIDLAALSSADCPACQGREFPWLEGRRGSQGVVLCGRNAVQLSPPAGLRISLDDMAARLAGVGQVSVNPFLLRLAVDGYALTVFLDGRAIVSGTDDVTTARTLYARYVGA